MIGAHLPILQVVLPILVAPVCVVFYKSRLAWLLASAASWLSLIIALTLLLAVSNNGSLSYDLGSWPAPWGIEYRIDILSAYINLIVTAIGAITITTTYQSVLKEIDEQRIPLFYTAFLLSLGGLLGIVCTHDAFNMFVFLEISSLSSYALIAIGNDRKALTSAYDYLIVGTIGATFILIGIGLLYSNTGTLNITDLHNQIQSLSHRRSIHAAFAFFTVGIFLKLAMFPLHYWLPNAYAHSPSTVSVFLAATSTKVALYMLFRIFYSLFGEQLSFDALHLDRVLLPLSILAVLASSAIAMYQPGLKRMLAYSSLSNIGYMTLGISTLTANGLVASIVHLSNHAITKGALFMCAACIANRLGTTRIANLDGIGKTMPWTMGAFVVSGLSLIGIPLTAGFVTKWYLVLAAIEKGWWWMIAVIVISSLMAVVYIWKVIERAYFYPPQNGTHDVQEAPVLLLVGTWILALSTIFFGLDTRYTLGLAKLSADLLLAPQ